MAAKPQAPTVTTIHALGDDLLREIFLRLPSLPSLVRAALTCRAFLAAVRSSPAFRRRFRSLHPPPLLGFFFESIGSDIASFSPLRRHRSDPDAAAVRGADVCLTCLPCNEDALPGWKIEAIRGDALLLLDRSAQQLAVYTPLTRALDLLPMPPDEIRSGCVGELSYMNFFLLYPDEVLLPPSSFRVVSLCHDTSRVRASVFSSGSREWLVLPWSEAAPAQPSGVEYWLLHGAEAGGDLYFAHAEQPYMVVVETTTLQYSFIDLPEHLEGAGHLYMTGETEDGELCIVSVDGFTLHIWLRRADNDAGNEMMWMLHSEIPLEKEILQAAEIPEDELDTFGLKVYAVLDSIVYMFTMEQGQPSAASWFLSFCLETGELEKLFCRTFDNLVFPYFMSWPSLLVGDDMSI